MRLRGILTTIFLAVVLAACSKSTPRLANAYMPSPGSAAVSSSPSAGATALPSPSSSEPWFVGSWLAHTSSLKISPLTVLGTSGYEGDLTFRTYTWCGPGVAPPCDTATSIGIIPGGLLTFFVDANGTGTINTDTANQSVVGDNITLVQGDEDTLTIQDITSQSIWRFCGPNSPSGYCGA